MRDNKNQMYRGQTGRVSWIAKKAASKTNIGKEIKKSQKRSSWISSGQNILTY